MVGRRKISMGFIFDKQRRHVTFSKRVKGLFKKAQELCHLTGAAARIVCLSEAGNASTSPTLLLSTIKKETMDTGDCSPSCSNIAIIPVAAPSQLLVHNH
ncbi:Serum response factor-like protein [Nymphaea thermarum]|nr:Serum response factor-like protein [Nymphaea thermarum]